MAHQFDKITIGDMVVHVQNGVAFITQPYVMHTMGSSDLKPGDLLPRKLVIEGDRLLAPKGLVIPQPYPFRLETKDGPVFTGELIVENFTHGIRETDTRVSVDEPYFIINHFKEETMEKALEFNVSGIKCDHCDYKDESVKVEDYKDWLNKPCPKCGANLLTEADYNNVQYLLIAGQMANEMHAAGLLPTTDTLESGQIVMDGSGRMEIRMEGGSKLVIDPNAEDKVILMPPLKMHNLEKCFESAKAEGAAFVGVVFELPGTEDVEFIINPNCNFDAKLEYYKAGYDEDLNHKKAPGVKIVGFTYGDSFADIQAQLLG